MTLNDCREKIDEIDAQLIALFCQRMDVAAEIGRLKRQQGLPVFNEAREQAVLDKIAQQAGDTYAPYARELYRAMFSVSKAFQSTILK